MGSHYLHASNLPKIWLLLGDQKALKAQVGPSSDLFMYNSCSRITYKHFMFHNDLLYALNRLLSFLQYKHSWTPYTPFMFNKSSHAQLESHSFFLAYVPYSFLDLDKHCLLLLLLHKLLKSRNQVLTTSGFPKVIYVVAYLQQGLVINAAMTWIELNQTLSEWGSVWMCVILLEWQYYQIRDLKTRLSCDLIRLSWSKHIRGALGW